jgi:hypothetical protein
MYMAPRNNRQPLDPTNSTASLPLPLSPPLTARSSRSSSSAYGPTLASTARTNAIFTERRAPSRSTHQFPFTPRLRSGSVSSAYQHTIASAARAAAIGVETRASARSSLPRHLLLPRGAFGVSTQSSTPRRTVSRTTDTISHPIATTETTDAISYHTTFPEPTNSISRTATPRTTDTTLLGQPRPPGYALDPPPPYSPLDSPPDSPVIPQDVVAVPNMLRTGRYYARRGSGHRLYARSPPGNFPTPDYNIIPRRAVTEDMQREHMVRDGEPRREYLGVFIAAVLVLSWLVCGFIIRRMWQSGGSCDCPDTTKSGEMW